MKIRNGLGGLAVAAFAIAALLGVGAASASAAHKMCKSNEPMCKAGNNWMAGTSVKGAATNTKITVEPIIEGKQTFIEITCGTANLQGKTAVNEGVGAATLKVTMESMTFGMCSSKQAETCTVTQSNIALEGGFFGTGTGTGTFETNAELTIKCTKPNFECIYTSQGALKAIGGMPGAIEAAGQMEQVPPAKENCPSVSNWSGKYVLSAPEKVWFTN
ncbi:MAG TPA: hypothetical protein VN733_05400 [Solirubrobacterales bacterium]|nr:hypothetical protein [Solirubrobacterales bacterium]